MVEQAVNTQTGEIVPVESAVNLFGTPDPIQVMKRAGEVANALATVIRTQKLTSNIQGKEYVRVEGWTLLGSMLGVFPVCVWTKPVEGGWEARVEARTLSGALVGAAEAQCLSEERNWGDRDDYALRSMAQTRATSKAMRLPLGFVVALAGFQTTPAEEVPAGGFSTQGERRTPLGMCRKHNMPYLQSAKQKQGGFAPSHPIKGTQPTQWCERRDDGPANDAPERDSTVDEMPAGLGWGDEPEDVKA